MKRLGKGSSLGYERWQEFIQGRLLYMGVLDLALDQTTPHNTLFLTHCQDRSRSNLISEKGLFRTHTR